ncbi:unnamed protein product [Amoebophrya sp. A120]|nr:unnamed protein product [Amoebophrya sp. A120]|eukprot:GSA120T00007790001.1
MTHRTLRTRFVSFRPAGQRPIIPSAASTACLWTDSSDFLVTGRASSSVRRGCSLQRSRPRGFSSARTQAAPLAGSSIHDSVVPAQKEQLLSPTATLEDHEQPAGPRNRTTGEQSSALDTIASTGDQQNALDEDPERAPAAGAQEALEVEQEVEETTRPINFYNLPKYGISGPKSVIENWPFLVRKSLKQDLQSATDVTFVFGPQGSGARSAMRNALERELDFDFYGFCSADENYATAEEGEQQDWRAYSFPLLVETFVEELTETIPPIGPAGWEELRDGPFFEELQKPNPVTETVRHRQGLGSRGSTIRTGTRAAPQSLSLDRHWLTLCAKIALDEVSPDQHPAVSSLRETSALTDSEWADLRQRLASVLKKSPPAHEEGAAGKKTISKGKECWQIFCDAVRSVSVMSPSSSGEIPAVDASSTAFDKVEFLVDLLTKDLVPGKTSSSASRRSASTDQNSTSLLDQIYHFLLFLRHTRMLPSALPRTASGSGSAAAQVDSNSERDQEREREDHVDDLGQEAYPSADVLAFANCGALLRNFNSQEASYQGSSSINYGAKFLGLVEAVFSGHPVLLHMNGDGMALLEQNPQNLITVGLLSEKMAKSLCELVLAKHKISLECNLLKNAELRKRYEVKANPLENHVDEFYLSYWDFKTVYKFLGGHVRHLKLFLQELIALAAKTEKPTTHEEQDKLRHEFQCPKNLTHQLLRVVRHAVLAGDTLQTEYKIQYFLNSCGLLMQEGDQDAPEHEQDHLERKNASSSGLCDVHVEEQNESESSSELSSSLQVQQTQGQDQKKSTSASAAPTPDFAAFPPAKKMRIMETVRLLIDSDANQGEILVNNNFDITNPVLLALLDAQLLIPDWDPARLQFPNEYTKHCLRLWVDEEFLKLGKLEKLKYQAACWQEREGIKQSVKRISC